MNPHGKWPLLVLAALPLLAVGAAEPLNVRLGLWEVTSETSMSGIPPLPKEVLDRLTPEQRAAMEAAIKAQANEGPLRETTQECITKDDLDNPFNTADAENCEQTLVTSTSTRQEMRLVCTGERTGSGYFRINTPTPETMTGEFELKVTNGADTMTVGGKMQGKWLSAECEEE